jgi:HEAT repeat protein
MEIRQTTPEIQRMLQDIWMLSKGLDLLGRNRALRVSLIRQVAESDDVAAIPAIADLVLDKSPEVAEAASDCVHRLLLATPVERLPSLEEAVRYNLTERWDGRWRQLKPAQVAHLPASKSARSSIMGLASFCPSGYVREAAVHELARIEDGSELPFLLLRANDWVATVRGFAIVALRRRLVPSYFDHLARNAQLVLRLADCGRDKHDDIIEWFTSQLVGSQHETVFLEIVRGPNRWLRRRSFRSAIEHQGSHLDRITRIGLGASDVVLRFLAARRVRHNFVGKELADALLIMERDRYMPVRREALLARVERQPEQAAAFLEKELLDRSAAVREVARFYLGRMGRSSFAEVYRSVLPQDPEIALLGLADTGVADDVQLALPFLQHSKVPIRVAAVRLVASLGGDKFTDDLMTALQDRSKKVTLAAARGLQGDIADLSSERLWNIAQTSRLQHVQLAATDLLDAAGGWSAISFLFRLSVHSDDRLASRARHLIAHRINRVFTAPSQVERQRIQEAIDETRDRLPERFTHDFETWLACR